LHRVTFIHHKEDYWRIWNTGLGKVQKGQSHEDRKLKKTKKQKHLKILGFDAPKILFLSAIDFFRNGIQVSINFCL